MIIASSSIEMNSKNHYKSRETVQNMSLIERKSHSVQFDLDKSSGSLYNQLKDHQAELEREQIEEQMKEYKQNLEEAKKNNNKKDNLPKSKHELKVEIMNQIMNMIERVLNGKGIFDLLSPDNSCEENNIPQENTQTQQTTVLIHNDEATLPPGVWRKTVVNSYFFKEEESVAYTSTGIVRCADGREINFDMTMELSRTFCETYDTFVQRDIITLDPLVINFNGTSPDISDMKFLFDLNNDGKGEEISSLGNGSGFLSLDKNHDGKINNGSELFGTDSGDGFADLSAYDEDHNGWIDEADAVFKDLVVWTKDENGEDRLISLKDADVGAIYLGSAATEYTYKGSHYYENNAFLRSTGIFMKESGGVGTISHVDFAV